MNHFTFFLFLLFVSGVLSGQQTTKQDYISSGKKLYLKKCASCHGKNGLGKGKRIPPLAGSDYLESKLEESIQGILFGQEGQITVNGIVYNKKMRPIKLTDQEVAAVMNYVRNSWGNKSENFISEEQVTKLRNRYKDTVN